MLQLSADECRVLGVLIEKAQTTPAQYPLTLNSIVVGCNQKSNRFPVTSLDEDRALDALDRLRAKGLVREALLTGSRVAKFRHLAREVLHVDTPELVLLAELMLRGPQSLGDLRIHASRMHAFDSLEAVQQVLDALRARPEPFVKPVPAAPGQRATRHAQLLCPDLHALDAAPAPAEDAEGSEPDDEGPAGHSALTGRVSELEREVETLRTAIRTLAHAVGADAPL